MKTITVSTTEKNIRVANKYQVSITEFCGCLTITGRQKDIRKIAKRLKVLI